MNAYAQALDLAEECDRHGIPTVNRVDRLLNATKFRGSQLMAAAGVRVPRMALVDDPKAFEQDLHGLRLPLFIREDWGHDRKCFRVDSPEDVSQVPWEMFKRALAVEITDVRSPRDGLFRKYRFVSAGDVGVSHHLHVSQEWITRGDNRVINPLTRAEELEYITQPDSNHELLHQARRALGLDLVAFDYGYTPDGRMIVWEANPFPHFVFARKRLPYKNPAMHRTMLAIVHLYFTAGELPIPAQVTDGLQLDFADVERRYRIVRKTNLLDRLIAYPHAFPKWPA
jgi:hypothetical protein